MACDLHCHTKISDGSMGIEDLVAMAKRRGITTLSVTDHDTTAGATRAVIIGKRQGLHIIHGVEFSTADPARDGKAHLLCYMCETPDRLEGLCRTIGDRRKKAATDMVRRVMRYYPITPEMVVRCATGSTNFYKQHIMHALMDAGYADSIFGDVYKKLFGKDGNARVEVEYPDVRDVIELIHSAGGLAVLAHPYLYKNEELLEELAEKGLDGVEVWHPSHSEEQVEALKDFAAQKHLLMTGGSDFHGMYTRQTRALGSTTCPDECVQAMVQYKAAKRKREL